MSASYSASLLDALKPSVRACSMTRPSGDWRTMPAPALLDVEDPSTKTFQDESRSSLEDCSCLVSVTTSAPLSPPSSVSSEFDSPFGDPSGEICLPEENLQWVFCYDHYREGLEVVGELSRGVNERQGKLFELQVPGLGVQQGFTRVIDRPLLAVVFSDEHRAHCMV
ncbi:hypothetical protein AAC387_Pa04g1318 [Persea americana]